MTRWNVPSGQSSHAEPIGRAWMEIGHQIVVFAPDGLDRHLLFHEDEPFVHRCFVQDAWGQRDSSRYFFDPTPYLREDYDIFVMEMAYLMPMPEMLEIFPQIKKKAKTVLVVHETGLPSDLNWYKFDWDAIVCFDARYKAFIAKAFPEKKIIIIPFPCQPPLPGDRDKARAYLGLPLEKKIVFCYGFDIMETHVDLFPVMENLSRDYPILLFLVTHHDATKLSHVPDFLLLKDEMPRVEKLYSYLHASDAYIYYLRKGEPKMEGVGVSSSVAMCLGAGRPVLVPGYCNFFDLAGAEVIKYGNLQELVCKLRDIFEGAESIKKSLAAANEYATRNSGAEIAARFIELFRGLLSETPQKYRERPVLLRVSYTA